MSSEDERETDPVHVFKRGSLERSPSKSQRMKNFKGLRIDLVAAKNRMRSQCGSLAGQRNAKVADGNVNTETKEKENTDQNISSEEDEEEKEQEGSCSSGNDSDYYPSDFDFELEESIKEAESKIEELEGYPSDFEEELERGIQDAEDKIRELRGNDLTKSVATGAKDKPPCSVDKQNTLIEDLKVSPDEEEELFQEISDQISSTLSDEEEAFDNLSLSMDITDNLSEDEDIFDKLSMNIQMEDEVFENLEKNKKSSGLECDSSPVELGNPNEENETAEAESNKAKQGISFWEEKLAKPKVNLRKDSTSNFDKEKASKYKEVLPKPKPTPRNTKKFEPTKCDNGSAFKATQESLQRAEEAKECNKKEPNQDAAAQKAQDDSPVEEKFERFTRQRSTVRRSKRVSTSSKVVVAPESETADTAAAATTSAPVPRKRESLAKRCDPLNSAKALKRPDDRDDKDELTRKISQSLEQRIKVNPYVDIKTWEERRDEPGRKLPEKELLGWF